MLKCCSCGSTRLAGIKGQNSKFKRQYHRDGKEITYKYTPKICLSCKKAQFHKRYHSASLQEFEVQELDVSQFQDAIVNSDVVEEWLEDVDNADRIGSTCGEWSQRASRPVDETYKYILQHEQLTAKTPDEAKIFANYVDLAIAIGYFTDEEMHKLDEVA